MNGYKGITGLKESVSSLTDRELLLLILHKTVLLETICAINQQSLALLISLDEKLPKEGHLEDMIEKLAQKTGESIELFQEDMLSFVEQLKNAK